VAPEVLQWLRADPIFISGSPAFEAMKYGFRSPDRNNRKTLEGRKLIIAGSAGGPAASGSMCNLSLKDAIPSSRVNAWFRAFRATNSVVSDRPVAVRPA